MCRKCKRVAFFFAPPLLADDDYFFSFSYAPKAKREYYTLEATSSVLLPTSEAAVHKRKEKSTPNTIHNIHSIVKTGNVN